MVARHQGAKGDTDILGACARIPETLWVAVPKTSINANKAGHWHHFTVPRHPTKECSRLAFEIRMFLKGHHGNVGCEKEQGYRHVLILFGTDLSSCIGSHLEPLDLASNHLNVEFSVSTMRDFVEFIAWAILLSVFCNLQLCRHVCGKRIGEQPMRMSRQDSCTLWQLILCKLDSARLGRFRSISSLGAT